MPSNETEKIKSAPKPFLLTLRSYGAVITVAILLLFLVTAFFSTNQSRLLRIGDTTYELAVAKTEVQQRKGLGETSSLGAENGMLFTYEQQKEHCFWMKAMRYPIDIIWIGADKKITAIEQAVGPATYPKTFCHNGQYVIELNAGEAARHGLFLGQTLNF